MRIIEVFRSVQGEGIFIGIPSTFVRIFGCNLSCSWCDTKYAWDGSQEGQELSVKELMEKILHFDTKHVVITGGEPLLYPKDLKELCSALYREGKTITIETNGTIFISGLEVDLMSISPKLPSAEQPQIVLDVVQKLIKTYHSQLKFVIGDEGDLAACMSLLTRVSLLKFDGPIIQPNGMNVSTTEYIARLKALTEKLFLDETPISKFFRHYKSARILPQQHVITFGGEQGY